MAPLDAVGSDVVGSVQAVTRSQAVTAGPVGGSDGSSPLDDFLRQHATAWQHDTSPPVPIPLRVDDDEPRFGRVTLSAGVGDVLIYLQAERPVDAELSPAESQRIHAAYAVVQSRSEALRRGIEEDRAQGEGSFWGASTVARPFPVLI